MEFARMRSLLLVFCWGILFWWSALWEWELHRKQRNSASHSFNTSSTVIIREMQGYAKGWRLRPAARGVSLRGKHEPPGLDLCSQKMTDNFNHLMWARFYWMPFFFLMESWNTTKNKESVKWGLITNSPSVLTHVGWPEIYTWENDNSKTSSKGSHCHWTCFPHCNAVGP